MLDVRDVGSEAEVTVNGIATSIQGSTIVALVLVTPEITSLTAVGTTAARDTDAERLPSP